MCGAPVAENLRLQQQPLRRTWASHGKTLLGFVEQEIEMYLGAQLGLDVQ